MNILKELDELTKAEVITPEAAEKIRHYYKLKGQNSGNKLFIVFGILGAILVGLGIILIIAHNWDNLSKTVKVVFAYLPLILAQLLCGYSFLKKADNAAWRESSSAFLFFGVGASISLVSQIYNISGDLPSFLMTWMLLCLPMVYLLRSSITSLLYIAGITYYCWESNHFFSHNYSGSYHYWWLLLLIIPHYYLLVKNRPDSNFTVFHNWIIPLSLAICLGSVARQNGDLMYMAYMSMFGLFYLIGSSHTFSSMKRHVNGYLVIGSYGTAQILLTLSFDHYWNRMIEYPSKSENWTSSAELGAIVFFTLAALLLLVYQNRKGINNFHPTKVLFLIFIFVFMLGGSSPNSAVAIINFLILATGIIIVRNGVRADHFGILNYGLLMITALIVCRFFDSNMSFVIRGLLFVLVGAGFFVTNYLMLKKRKQTV